MLELFNLTANEPWTITYEHILFVRTDRPDTPIRDWNVSVPFMTELILLEQGQFGLKHWALGSATLVRFTQIFLKILRAFLGMIRKFNDLYKC